MDPTPQKFAQPLRILVVEDNPVDRRILESMLAESPAVISLLKTASTLADAIQFLEQHEFDAIILDLNLPDSEGKDTLLRLSSQYPQITIVINTGAYEDEVGLHTLSYGAQDFLVKGKYTAYVLNKALYYAVERKRLELELNEAYKHLQEAQSQIAQMEKMKVVGALASGIAHEIKNPLSTIMYGMAYLSEHGNSSDPKIQAVLKNIKEAVNRANDIVNDLLHFAATASLNKKPEDLNEVIEKSLSLIHHEIEKKHIQVIKKLDDGIPEVNIDRNRIEQVLINLMLNAIHAAPEGGQLELKTYCQSVPGDSQDPRFRKFRPGQTVVVCDVEDNGSGIPTEYLVKVFEPFFTTKHKSGGIGLGLSVSKSIMDNHDGIVQIENRSEHGARARLVFHPAESEGFSR